MGKQADVYSNWLGITETARPLNHYQLLRLDKFEDDPGKIRNNYNKMNGHVRKYLSTEYADKAHALLDELTKAMFCLTDSRRKSDYDATLGRAGSGELKKRSLEEILLARKLLDQEQLAKAKNLAKAIGVDLRDAVLQQKLGKPEAVVQAYAESQGLPYVDLAEMEIDAALAAKLPAVLARQHSCVPLMADEEKVLIASPNVLRSDIEDEVRLRFGAPVRIVLCTPSAIHEVVAKHYPREAAAAQMGVTSRKDAVDDSRAGRLAAMDPDARKKQRTQRALLALAFPFMVVMLAANFLGLSASLGDTIKFALIGLAIGGTAGGITWKLN